MDLVDLMKKVIVFSYIFYHIYIMSAQFGQNYPGPWLSGEDLVNFQTFKSTRTTRGGTRIKNVGTPVEDTDVATKEYVDNNPNNLDFILTSPMIGDVLVYNGTTFVNSSKLMDVCNQIVAIKYQAKPTVTALSTTSITVRHAILPGFWATSGIRVYKNYSLSVDHSPITANSETFAISAAAGDTIHVQTYISAVSSAMSMGYIVDIDSLATNLYDPKLGSILTDQNSGDDLTGTFTYDTVLNGNPIVHVALSDVLVFPTSNVKREFRTSAGGAFAAVVKPLSGSGIMWGTMDNSLQGWALWQKNTTTLSIRINTSMIFETDITVDGDWAAIVASTDGTTVNWAVNGVLGVPFMYTADDNGYSGEQLACGDQPSGGAACELNVGYLSYYEQPFSSGVVQLYSSQLATRFGLL